MPKVTYTPGKGLVQSAGTGFEVSVLPSTPVQPKTANVTVASPGVYTLSGSTATPVTGTMPLASDFPGGIFVFRYGSADQHVLTGSAEAQGVMVFKGTVTGSEAQAQGSKLQIFAGVGASVALISDGKSYLVMANSGSLTFSGT